MPAAALHLVLHCQDCQHPTTLDLPLGPTAPVPAEPVCRICGGGRWRIVLGRRLPAMPEAA